MSGEESISNDKASEKLEFNTTENLSKKFRLIEGEKIHMTNYNICVLTMLKMSRERQLTLKC